MPSTSSRFLLRALFFMGLGLTSMQAQTTTTINFGDASVLTGQFTGTGSSLSFSSSGGLGGGGGVTIASGNSGIQTFNSTIANSGSYVVSAYMFNGTGNSGYGGLGFATASSNTLAGSAPWSPANSIGVTFHGGGGDFTNNSSSASSLTWPPGISDDTWYKYTLTVTAKASNTFDLSLLIQTSDANGFITGTYASKSVTDVVNSSVGAATQLQPYFLYQGTRFTAVDNFSVTASAIPEPSTYAVWGGLVAGAFVLIRRRRRQG